MKRKFVIDEEISFVNEHDILKTQVYADSLVKIIKNTPQDKVFTIGLFGSWGSGKSSIIKTTKDIIEQEDDKVKFITYDAWKYVNDSFRRMFLLKIQQELKQGQTEVMQRFYQSESVEAEPKTYVSTNYLGILCLALLTFFFIINFSPLKFETTNAGTQKMTDRVNESRVCFYCRISDPNFDIDEANKNFFSKD